MRLRHMRSVCAAAMVGMLVSCSWGGSPPPEKEYASIFEAAQAGDWAGVRNCMRVLGEEVNQRDANGDTVLHYAAFGGSAEVIRNLVAFGADPNVQDASGKTPLQVAQEAGHEEAVEVLQELMTSQ
jgi:ankyrin repeat protein